MKFQIYEALSKAHPTSPWGDIQGGHWVPSKFSRSSNFDFLMAAIIILKKEFVWWKSFLSRPWWVDHLAVKSHFDWWKSSGDGLGDRFKSKSKVPLTEKVSFGFLKEFYCKSMILGKSVLVKATFDRWFLTFSQVNCPKRLRKWAQKWLQKWLFT